MADLGDPEDWELVNDDGFVYKRKKRPRLDSSAAQQPPDPAVERRHRRERKKKALVKLRIKYLKEITEWELLSNALKDMERTAQPKPVERQEQCPTLSSEQHVVPDCERRRLFDDLLPQVEAQDAMIRKVSDLCDMAEALCGAQEERMKQRLIDLPIWEPLPDELMASLGKQ